MELQTLLPILLSWAARLSGYPMPEELPEIQYQPHSFFVEQVCGGKECTAVGWYNDENIVYIDSKYQGRDSGFAPSLIVHELTHYLQHQSGSFNSLSCTDSVTREREAYRVQNEYIMVAQASMDLIKPAPTSCKYAASAATGPAAHTD